MKMTGGTSSPSVLPFIAARFFSHGGTVPNTLPAKALPMLVMICVRPEIAKPTPRVRIRAWPCSR